MRSPASLMTGIIVSCALVGCGHLDSAVTSSSFSASVSSQPHVIQKGHLPADWTQFVPNLSCGPGLSLRSIVMGPDKNVWLADPCGGLLQVTMSGATHEWLFDGFTPTQIAVGADSKFYMTQQGTDVIGVSDLRGDLQSYIIPSGDTVYDGGISLGPDGNVWFVETLHVGRIAPDGTIKEYRYTPSQTVQNLYGGIVTGSDGSVWLTDDAQFGEVLKVDPANGQMTELFAGCENGPIISAKPPSPWNVWVFCGSQTFLSGLNALGQSQDFGVQWPIAGGAKALPQAMILGPSGDPWWASSDGAVAQLKIHSRSVTAHILPDQADGAQAIANGFDGNVWVATASGKIDVYIVKILSVNPSSLNFTAAGEQQTIVVSESGHASWTAKTSDGAVATVAPGQNGSEFVVTSVAIGTCTVTIRDNIRNSFPVSVDVL